VLVEVEGRLQGGIPSIAADDFRIELSDRISFRVGWLVRWNVDSDAAAW
jgi:hypothetical protein